MISWLTVYLDLPADRVDAAAAFWAAVTGAVPSDLAGDEGEYRVLVPDGATPVFAVQRLGTGDARVHLDLHVADIAGEVERAVDAGATVVEERAWTVLRSPAGFVHCLVGPAADPRLPRPHAVGGRAALADQLVIDVPAEYFAAEVDYWTTLTGWSARSIELHPEFTVFEHVPALPLRLLMQRLDDDDGRAVASAHLDVAAGDGRDDVVGDHTELGARVVQRSDEWTTMVDPAGLTYCVLAREPLFRSPRRS